MKKYTQNILNPFSVKKLLKSKYFMPACTSPSGYNIPYNFPLSFTSGFALENNEETSSRELVMYGKTCDS